MKSSPVFVRNAVCAFCVLLLSGMMTALSGQSLIEVAIKLDSLYNQLGSNTAAPAFFDELEKLYAVDNDVNAGQLAYALFDNEYLRDIVDNAYKQLESVEALQVDSAAILRKSIAEMRDDVWEKIKTYCLTDVPEGQRQSDCGINKETLEYYYEYREDEWTLRTFISSLEGNDTLLDLRQRLVKAQTELIAMERRLDRIEKESGAQSSFQLSGAADAGLPVGG